MAHLHKTGGQNYWGRILLEDNADVDVAKQVIADPSIAEHNLTIHSDTMTIVYITGGDLAWVSIVKRINAKISLSSSTYTRDNLLVGYQLFRHALWLDTDQAIEAAWNLNLPARREIIHWIEVKDLDLARKLIAQINDLSMRLRSEWVREGDPCASLRNTRRIRMGLAPIVKVVVPTSRGG